MFIKLILQSRWNKQQSFPGFNGFQRVSTGFNVQIYMSSPDEVWIKWKMNSKALNLLSNSQSKHTMMTANLPHCFDDQLLNEEFHHGYKRASWLFWF